MATCRRGDYFAVLAAIGLAAAIGNAILDATGISIKALPLLPEPIYRALALLREKQR